MLSRITRPLAVSIAFGCLAVAPVSAMPRDPSGIWKVQDNRARIRLEKCGATNENLCGYVVWMESPDDKAGKPRLDAKNPDRTKTVRPLLGHQLVMGLKPNADDRYEGQIYNNEDGKFYDVTIWLETDLKVKGCLVAFLCSTQTWKRQSDLLAGQLAGPTGAPDGPRADPEWATIKPASATTAAPRRDARPRP